jgi:hypothetical protein
LKTEVTPFSWTRFLLFLASFVTYGQNLIFISATSAVHILEGLLGLQEYLSSLIQQTHWSVPQSSRHLAPLSGATGGKLRYGAITPGGQMG